MIVSIARSLPIRGACHSRPGLLSSGTRSTWYRRLPALSSVVVSLDSQACQSGSGATCTTTPGATFTTVPITLYIYGPPATDSTAPGPLLAYDTQTFTVPYRPSAADVANPGYCTGGTNWSGYTNDGSQWYDPNNGNCYYGIDYTASFSSFTWTTNATSTVLPSTIVYGIAFTATSGPSASLNMEMSTEPTDVTLGSDADPGNVFVSTSSGSNSVGGTGGEITCSAVGTSFAQVSTTVDVAIGCGETESLIAPYAQWLGVPAVEFNVAASGFINLVPGGPGESVDFTITNNSTTTPAYVQSVTVSINPASLYLGCEATWFTIAQPANPLDLTIPPSGSINFQPSGGVVSLINEPYSQNACEGDPLTLTFNSN